MTNLKLGIEDNLKKKKKSALVLNVLPMKVCTVIGSASKSSSCVTIS